MAPAVLRGPSVLPRQFPAGADAANPRREQGQNQKQKLEFRLLSLNLNLNLNLILLLPATRRDKKALEMSEAMGSEVGAKPQAPWMAPTSPHGWVYGVFCADLAPQRPHETHRQLSNHPAASNKKGTTR
ncbi:hypothetical protein H3005_13155 [Stenotrophomonas sp. Br8]|uniref:hypothetical protein n=1 Tax=Stenotrophomonas sp. Br8 TaxID=2759658 RepID=UPI00168B5BC9|nr:hypothetical protein [Stenotrophomonas sp. Br8]MBD3682811.1 hypothetical protein [Stenotrophomonas sp. Br8]